MTKMTSDEYRELHPFFRWLAGAFIIVSHPISAPQRLSEMVVVIPEIHDMLDEMKDTVARMTHEKE